MKLDRSKSSYRNMKQETVASWTVRMSSKYQSFAKHRKLAIDLGQQSFGSENRPIFFQVYEPSGMFARISNKQGEEIEWEVDYSYPIENIKIGKVDGKICTFASYDEVKKLTKVREVMFESSEEAQNFSESVRKHKNEFPLENDQEPVTEMKNENSSFKTTTKPPAPLTSKTTATILIEIISIHNLKKVGVDIPDPYIVIWIDEKKEEIHRTDYVSNQIDPVWTAKSKSLFLFKVNENNRNSKLLFDVKDFNALRKDHDLGHCYVDVESLLSKGEVDRMSIPLHSISNTTATNVEKDVEKGKALKRLIKKSDANVGILNIRSRYATMEDMRFMNKLKTPLRSFRDSLVNLDEMIMVESDQKLKKGLFKSYEKKDADGTIRYLVRPCPDPCKPTDTKYLTKQEIQSACLSPSRTWINSGVGTLTRLFVEILYCDGLPQMDQSIRKEDSTDAFACLVFEDCVVTTDTIKDTLSPRWLPWTQRAFVFNMMSMVSRLHIGVFDKDSGVRERWNGHDYIGRIAIDVANYAFNMDYVLKFNLRDSKMDDNYAPLSPDSENNAPNGILAIRLRLECPDERQLLMSSLSIPDPVYINVETKKDFSLVHAAVYGDKDLSSYNLMTLTAWIVEILGYKTFTYYLTEGIMVALLWRGSYPVSLYLPFITPYDEFKRPVSNPQTFLKVFKRTVIFLPINSVVLFIAGITLIENPGLCVPYFFGSISCLMLVLLSYQNSNPSPWRKSKSFLDYMHLLVIGKAPKPPEEIRPNKNKAETYQYMKEIETRFIQVHKDAEEASAEYVKMQEEQSKHAMQVYELNSCTEIETKNTGLLIPFKSILYPIQLQLESIVYTLRFFKGVLLWENSFFSFWVTACSFGLFCITIFIPWNFIIRWTLRLLVWTFLGPWMMLVDMYYFKPLENLSEEEQALQREEAKKQQRETWDRILLNYKILREEAMKLRDMKICMFGDYIINVPHFERDKFRDIPRSDSYGTAVNPKGLSATKCEHITIPGQHLKGTMIPVLAIPRTHNSNISQQNNSDSKAKKTN